jgi:probable F420-dependent oxidoreductase
MSARVGIAVPIQYPLTVLEGVELAQRAEAAGYDSLWVPEDVGLDAFVLMTVIAGVTTRLHLGTGIVPILTRTPSLLAMTIASITQVAPGRIRLGLGVSTPHIVQNWHGMAYDRPLARLREYISIIRKAFAGERVTQENGIYPLRNFRLGPSSPLQPVPIYVAALNTRILQLAGALGDGVLLNWMPEDKMAWALEHLHTGAGKAGHTLADLDIACLIRTCVTDDLAAARQWLRRELTGYTIVEAYQRYFQQLGYGDEVETINTQWRAGDRAGAIDEVSDAMTDQLAVFGSAAQCRERLACFVDAGINLPIVFPFIPDTDYRTSIQRTLAAMGGSGAGLSSYRPEQ